MTTNEGTTINNALWLWIHLYTVQGWKIVTILLCVEIVRVFITFESLLTAYFSKGEMFLDFCALGTKELVKSWWKQATTVVMCCKTIDPMWPYNSMRR
jgi:hypothetical protein